MRRTLACTASAVLIATASTAQPADDAAAILAAAHAFDDAQLHGDRPTLERMIAPDFLFVRGSGRVGDRRDFIAGFTRPNARLEPFQVSDRLFLRLAPDVAVVGGEARLHGTEDGKPFVEHFRYSDTFARRGGRWLAVFTQVTPLPPG